MNIKTKIFAVIFLILIAVVAILFLKNPFITDEDNHIKHIPLVVYGNDATRWDDMKQGAELAFKDENIDISVITTASEFDSNEQIKLIEREIEDGADAIMIPPGDCNKLKEYIEGNNIKIPIVFMGEEIAKGKKYYSVVSDDYEMGKVLGYELISKEKPITTVAIISDGIEKESIKRREEGVRTVIEPYVNKIITWERKDNEDSLIKRKFLQRAILERAVDVVVALDNESTDALMEALENLNKQRKVYAISTSERSVYYLDKEKIKAIVYPSEFGMGYIGARYLVDENDFDQESNKSEVKYMVINKDNMYDEDVQKLIFPLE